LIRVAIVDRIGDRRMKGSARYMLGIVDHADPEAMGIDLRVLDWGREMPAAEWSARFWSSTTRRPLAQRVNRDLVLPIALRLSRSEVIHYPYAILPRAWTVGTGRRIVSLHGIARISSAQWVSTRGRRSGAALIERVRAELHKVARIITASQWFKGELLQVLNVPPEHIVAIPYGVDTQEFYPIEDEEETRAWVQATLGIEEPYLFHVGPCTPRKNILRLVRAYAYLKQRRHIPHKLVLAGAPGPASPRVREEVGRLGLRGDVLFPGVVSDDALVRLYNGASVFVFPSLYEGFGFPVLEAMACGTPVVTSNVAALPETAGGAAAMVDEPRNTGDLTAVIQKVLEDSAYRDCLKESGLARARAASWEKCARAHMELYRQAAEER